MPWRQEFLDFIAQDTIAPVYLFETIDFVNTTSADFSVGKPPMKFASAAVGDGEHVVAIDKAGCSITYGTLTPGEWSRSYGTLTVGLTQDPRELCTRGQVVALLIGAAGWSYSQFETVWLGAVRNVTYKGGRWAVECVELAGSLQNRYSSVSGEQVLFYSTFADTTLAVDYDPATDTDLEVTSSTAWDDLPPDFDDHYGLVVTPASGSSYYVLAATRTGDVFSGLLDSEFGTTSVAASAGDAVRVLVYSDAHPIRIIARILTASGTATGAGLLGVNGLDDVFPVNWGYGIWHTLIDRDDMDFWVDASGGDATVWRLVSDQSEADGQRWMTEWLQPGGFFLALHQGQLTCRAVTGDTGQATPGSVVVDDDDIVELSYETWDSLSPIEYRVSRANSASGADTSDVSESNIATRPSKARRRRDLLGAWNLNVLDTAAQIAVNEVVARLSEFDTRVPERVSVVTVGWRAAVASLGDQVYLSTDLLHRRTYPAAGFAFDGTPGVMVGGGPDWFGSTCQLDLLFPAPAAALE